MARGPDLPADYVAQVSCVYVRTLTGWSLALRQHTPDPREDPHEPEEVAELTVVRE